MDVSRGSRVPLYVLSDYRIFGLCTACTATGAMASEEKQTIERPGASTNSDSDLEIIAEGAVNEKSLLRKLDLRLLPAVSILYLLSFLDRSNGKAGCILLG